MKQPEQHVMMSVGRYLQRQAVVMRESAEKITGEHSASVKAMTTSEANYLQEVGNWLVEKGNPYAQR
jgi:SHS2 domain-containing protein